MNSVFQVFLDKGYKYNYRNGPNVISSQEQALKDGINCIGLMHLLIRELFGIRLPQNLRVLEIYNDNPYFKTIDKLEDIQMGDIIFLGRKQLPEYIFLYKPQYDKEKNLINEEEGRAAIGEKYAGYHTVMHTGDKDKNGNPLVIDIERIVDTVKVWSLNELMEEERYEVLYKIKRFII